MAGWDTSIFGDEPVAGPAYDPSIFGDEKKMRQPGKPSAEDVAMAKVEMPWAAVPAAAVMNAPASAKSFLGGMADMVMHPLDTAGGLWDVAAGGLRAATPEPIRNFLDRANSPEANQRIGNTASAVGDFYKNRYGTAEGFKQALATDPVGVAGDASLALTGGGGLLRAGAKGAALAGAPNVAREVGDVGRMASEAGRLTNPITPVIAAAKGATKLGGLLSSNVAGVMTGAGETALNEAYRAGRTGEKTFLPNLKGEVPMSDVVDRVISGVDQLKTQAQNAYRAGMAGVSNDKTVLNFAGIDKAVDSARDIGKFQGKIINQSVIDKMDDVQNAIREWKIHDPAKYHTPEGLDALKKQVSGILETIPFENKQARLAVNNVVKSIKSEITTQAPKYAEVMKDYHAASELIDELRSALSAKNTASADTTMRKLQSLMRNNVSTNYGVRQQLANQLISKTGDDFMPALAGQALNQWAPRGLARLGIPFAASQLHPAALAMLPLESPRLMGTAAYGAGLLGRGASEVASKIPIDPQSAQMMSLLAARNNQRRGQ